MSFRNKEYYIEAFEKLEKEGKHTWNWAAAFFPDTWMAYRRMYEHYGVWFLISMGVTGVLVLVGVAVAGVMGIQEVKEETIFWVMMLYALVAFLLYIIAKFAIFGYYGNSFYYRAVKAKVRDGDHLVEKFQVTSLYLVFLNFVSPLFVLGAYCFDCFRRDNDKTFEVTPESISQYLGKKRNRSGGEKVVMGINCTLIFISFIPTFILLLALALASFGFLPINGVAHNLIKGLKDAAQYADMDTARQMENDMLSSLGLIQ